MKGNITKMLQLREVQNRISQLDSACFPEIDLFHRETASLIEELFGKSSPHLDDWKKIDIPRIDYDDEDALSKYLQEWDTAKARMANICKVMIEEIGISETEKSVKTEESRENKTKSNRVFVVHGTDHTSLRELKTMLFEFGLNPIVLHEQPSGSRTIVEKLEKYSDVGYAFVILTPDDIGATFQELFEKTARSSYEGEALEAARRILEKSKGNIERFIEFNDKFMQDPDDATKFLQFLVPRARQNVILEFGYFMGLLGRERVCCLYKGDVELPSDMHGIVYVSFRESVNEVRDMIIKELESAGYEIKDR